MASELRARPVSWTRVLPRGLFEAYLWALATIAIFWPARRFPLERGRVPQRIAVHLVGAIVLSLVRAAVAVEMSRHVDWLVRRPFSEQFSGSSSQNILFYALLLGIACNRTFSSTG